MDLYCADGTPVCAVEPGVVVWSGPFTGPAAESPWWLDTLGVCVRGDWWTILYGELRGDLPKIGAVIKQGDLLGYVAQVLKTDKGTPTAMLHFELYDRTVNKPVWWRKDESKPEGLLDPTDLLVDTLKKGTR